MQRYKNMMGYCGILVNPHVKIQFEINSQLAQIEILPYEACESSRKNTI